MRASLIAADVAWDYNKGRSPQHKFGRGMTRYPGLSKAQILSLPVPDIAAENCALFFWVVPTQLRRDYIPMEIMGECFRAWGFRWITKAFCWVKVDFTGKPRKLPGHYTASNTEDCFLAIRGKMPVATKMVEQVLISPLAEHSAKPAEAYERMVRMYGDVPRVELFARDQKPGWVALGNQIDGQDIHSAMRAYAAL